jgi:hypothetical protein
MISLRSWISARGLYLYSQVICHTARYHPHGEEHVDALVAAGRPAICTSWHGSTMMIAGYYLRHHAANEYNPVMIVPDDWRGEVLTEWCRLMGTKAFTVSMQEESFVAARRLLQLVRRVRDGAYAYINPDGPDGPSGVPKPGIAFLAGKSGAAVLPIGVYSRSRIQLPRWDRYSVPLPYSHITLAIGEPLAVDRQEDSSEACSRIAAAINLAMAEAESRHRP